MRFNSYNKYDILNSDYSHIEYIEDVDKVLSGDKYYRVGKFHCKDCGNVFTKQIHIFKSIGYKCSCKKITKTAKHYSIFNSIKSRCLNNKLKVYESYGGRGISLYKDWENNYLEFEEYIKQLPNYNYKLIKSGKLTLDRIDNDGNYEPDNLRWATYKEQAANKRNRLSTKYNGVYYNSYKKKYQVSLNDRAFYIGLIDSEHEAVKIKDDWIINNNLTNYNLDYYFNDEVTERPIYDIEELLEINNYEELRMVLRLDYNIPYSYLI